MSGLVLGIIFVVILVIVLLLAVFWDSCCLGSSNCGSSGKKVCSKDVCDDNCECDICGCSPCSCECAKVCKVSRTLITAGDGSNGDVYQIVISGKGFNSSSVSSIVLELNGANDPGPETFTLGDTSGNGIVYTSDGETMVINYVTPVVDTNTGNVVASGNMSAVFTHSLSSGVLTVNGTLPLVP